jgi:hypothetical protein
MDLKPVLWCDPGKTVSYQKSCNRIVFMASRDTADGNNTGWQTMGTWSVQ